MTLKKNITVLFFIGLAFLTNVTQAQTTIDPKVDKNNYSNCKITSVYIDDSNTKVTIEYEKTKREQALVYISKNTVLFDFYNRKNYYRIESLGDNQLDTKYATNGKNGQKYYFTLVFPRLPPGIEKISIVELVSGDTGFEWDGILIDNPKFDYFAVTDWSESSLKNDWKINGIDGIEGIYESTDIPKYKAAIKKNNKDGYDLIYLSGGENMAFSTWEQGAIKASLFRTAKQDFYNAHWLMFNKALDKNVYTTFDQATMRVMWTDKKMEQIWIKNYPLSPSPSKNNIVSSSGSGFALTNSGLIVTNNHVIDGANSITVKGINGDFTNSYNAKVIANDKNNDLAIIQIDDDKFSSTKKIPYAIKSLSTDVGENVFTLGYPLRATMGEEIKLTNGIISSRTGFQGDITSYQISVPLQPGNSGGPLFDKFGNLIGVIKAKLSGGENVSYAVKISYLKNLIDLLPTTPTLNTISSISKLSLAEQVKILNKYVYIIEIK